MEKAKYLIGDVANLVGVSRDTLRYYEKRGILETSKDANGYRYYTERDISSLVGILYQRKMNIGLSEIQMLWGTQNTLEGMTDVIDGRLEEEQKAIRERERTIVRLTITKKDCENLQNNMGKVLLQNIPASYIIVGQSTMLESVEIWFEYAKRYSGMDMMYMLDEYVWEHGEPEKPEIYYKNTQLILYQDVAEYADYEIDKENTPMLSPTLCVSTFLASLSRTPDVKDIVPMLEWAKEQGIALSDRLYISYALQGIRDGERMYYLYLYIPVLM